MPEHWCIWQSLKMQMSHLCLVVVRCLNCWIIAGHQEGNDYFDVGLPDPLEILHTFRQDPRWSGIFTNMLGFTEPSSNLFFFHLILNDCYNPFVDPPFPYHPFSPFLNIYELRVVQFLLLLPLRDRLNYLQEK